MNKKQIIAIANAAFNEREKEPPGKQFERLVAAGIIDSQGNVICHKAKSESESEDCQLNNECDSNIG